jgi:hypothetical protein
MARSFAGTGSSLGMAPEDQILDAAVEGGQMGEIHFGDLNLQLFFEGQGKIQEIHGIELELIPEPLTGLDVIDICFGGDLPDDPHYDLGDLLFKHFFRSPVLGSLQSLHGICRQEAESMT